jgi:hypothetical protein
MAQGIERLEIEGDWYEEIDMEEQIRLSNEIIGEVIEEERREANEQAPVQPPPTDEEMQAHFEDWKKRHLIVIIVKD